MDAGFWNNRYAAPQYIYGETPNAFVAEMASQIPAGPVLCLAEGEGRNAVHLATLGHRVTAVDQSEAGLAKARRLAALKLKRCLRTWEISSSSRVFGLESSRLLLICRLQSGAKFTLKQCGVFDTAEHLSSKPI